MNQDLSIFTLVTQASLVVQLVMAGLMVASVASWTVIFGKLFGLRRVRTFNEDFEREFWAGKNLNDLYADATQRAAKDVKRGAPMQRIASRYARFVQRKVPTTGHLFERRYRAILVDDARYLLELVRYIHLNPVRAGSSEDPMLSVKEVLNLNLRAR